MLTDETWAGLSRITSAVTRSEAEVLWDLAAECHTEHAIVEVGTYHGRGAALLALAAHEGNGASVFTVDPHETQIGVGGSPFGPRDGAIAARNLDGLDVTRIVARSMDAAKAWKAWGGPPAGLVFIDGDHRYEGVLADFNAWAYLSGLVPVPVVAFHDADMPGPAQVIDEIQGEGWSLAMRVEKLAIMVIR